MKKIIAATTLALGLAFTVAPAQADDPAHPTPPPTVCIDPHFGDVISCDPCAFALGEARTALEVTIAAQQEKIVKQRATIKRLRHRLHSR